jgi:RNA polymerase sigma factor (TIGR02999 family)
VAAGAAPDEISAPRAVADDSGAGVDHTFAVAYDELHELARRQRRRWHGNDTLNTTALVHEAYVKLVAQGRLDVEGRAHFLALASKTMRHILCNHARAARAQKRGGAAQRLTLDPVHAPADAAASDDDFPDVLVALDEALRRLERLDARQGSVVECRFFGGLTIDETAAALGISPRTVKRDWQVAQAWLAREIGAAT